MSVTNQLAATHPPFDYEALPADKRSMLRTATTEIRDRIGRAAQNIVEIGTRLAAVKASVPHGTFRDWIDNELKMPRTSAWRMMNVAASFKSSNLEHLTIEPSALYLLASPSTPDELREEIVEQAKAGKTITHAAAKEAVKVAVKRKELSPITPDPADIPDEEPAGSEDAPSLAAKALPTPAPVAPTHPKPIPIEPWGAYNSAVDNVCRLIRETHTAALALADTDEHAPAFAMWIDAKYWRQFFNDTAITFESRKVVGFASEKQKRILPDGQPFLYEIDVKRIGKRKGA